MVLVLRFQQLRLSQLQTATEVVPVTGCFLVRPTETAHRGSMNHCSSIPAYPFSVPNRMGSSEHVSRAGGFARCSLHSG